MVVFNKEGNQPDHALLAGRSALALQREATALSQGSPGLAEVPGRRQQRGGAGRRHRR